MTILCRGTSDAQSTALQLHECYAKTLSTVDGDSLLGLDVESHCMIVGYIAHELMKAYPEILQRRLFPPGTVLLAASHDVGKINPIFQEKIRRSLYNYEPNSELSLKNARPELESKIDYHWGVGKISLRGENTYVDSIVGVHHGVNTTLPYLPDDSILGGPQWQSRRMDLIEKLKIRFSEDFPEISSEASAAFLAGLTTVADWIGSGTIFSDLPSVAGMKLEAAAAEALCCAGFIRPKIQKCLTFEQLFPSYTPYNIQRSFYREVDEPGLYIMEALMGQGKTEAALQAAYQLLSTEQATGIYFALPTQLTSEKIHERFQAFLENILEDDDQHHALLVHGNAWLMSTDMGKDALPGYSWFNSKKRSILAPFAVGTIDQALMAVINVKHGFVRTFGLAGKVVIIDEVHTYDAYTGTLIDYLITTLRELGCTVILLSATLTEKRKLALLKSVGDQRKSSLDDRYPLITKSTDSGQIEIAPLEDEKDRHVDIIHESNVDEVLSLVMKKAFGGEYVLWIENTVPDAQRIFMELAAWGNDNNIEVGLLHSRFPPIKRKSLDDHWTNIFGKPGIPSRGDGGKILVGTQVLEQSLDLDADLLVTRIAPSDMLLQRIGRLWRHEGIIKRRAEGAKREVVIIAPDIDDVYKNPEKAYGSVGMVYAPYILYRTEVVWRSLDSIYIPGGMREIIENTYMNQNDPDVIKSLKTNMDTKRENLKRQAMNSMSTMGKTSSDETAATRFSDIQTCDLLLLRRESDLSSGELVFLDRKGVTLEKNITSHTRKIIAKEIAERVLRVPQYIAPEPLQKSEMNVLRPFVYISDDENERLRVAVITDTNRIVGIGGRDVNSHYDLFYSQILGYRAVKR